MTHRSYTRLFWNTVNGKCEVYLMYKCKRISDIITEKDIQTWTPERPVIISAGTGSGKSYFVKNILYKHAKEHNQIILMLIHRRACVDQFRMEIISDNKSDVITVDTYQKIEYDTIHSSGVNLEKYDYIVSDEFHYFISDAAFNNKTDISLQIILKTNAVKIFMSATGDSVKEYLQLMTQEKPIEYYLKQDYSYIQNLYYCFKEQDFEEFAKELLARNEKAIFFVQKAGQAYKLYKSVKNHAVFNCSKSNEDFYKYVDADKIEKILREQRFEENFLITTCSMDAGVNLIDTDLKYIFTDVDDIGSLIQCVGRKRIQSEEDTVTVLCILAKNNMQLGGHKRQIIKQLEMAEYLRSHTVQEYTNKYYREIDRSLIVYEESVNDSDTCTRKINELMYLRCQKDLQVIDEMLNIGKFGFCKFLARFFGKYNEETDCYDYLVTKGDYKLNRYLEDHMDIIMYTVADRKELIETLNVRKDGKLLKSIESLNGALKEENIPYKIKQFKTAKIINGKKKYYKSSWKIVRHKWKKS